MQNLKTISTNELLASTKEAVGREKSAIHNVTRHFHEIDRRRAYLPKYNSLYMMIRSEYGYAESVAQMRVDAVKLINQVPGVEQKLETGELSMTTAAQIQTFLSLESRAHRPYSINAKIELVDACKGKSKIEVQREFVRRNPEMERGDSIHPVSETRTRISTTVDNETLDNLNELKDLLAHTNPNMTLGDLLKRLAKDGLEKYSPLKKAERARKRQERKKFEDEIVRSEKAVFDRTSYAENRGLSDNRSGAAHKSYDTSRSNGATLRLDEVKTKTRYVPAGERHQVVDDGNGCIFQDPGSGRRCRSKKFLQLDHNQPFSKGGANKAMNLRWMCGVHNRLRHETSIHY